MSTTTPPQASSWTVEPVAFHGGSAPPDLALDSAGVPHVLYCPPGDVRYAVRSSSGWVDEHIVNTIFGGVCGELAMGPGGVPHVTTPTVTGVLKELYGTKTGGVWDLAPYPGGLLDGVSAKGEPQVVTYWKLDTDLFSFRYLTLANGAWRHEEVETFAAPSVRGSAWASLVLDAQDNPHVLYYDEVRGDVRYALRDAAGWRVEVVEHVGAIGAVGRQGGLALDAQGNPHGVYVIRTQPQRLDTFYATKTSAGWTKELLTADRGGGYDPAIAVDPSGTPKVAYHDLAIIDASRFLFDLDLVYATRVAGTWVTEVAYGEGVLVQVQFVSLAVDFCGNPHIAFYLAGAPTAPHGVYYATKGAPCGHTSPADLTHEAVARIKALKEQAIDRGDERFVRSLDRAEEHVWKSLGYKHPFSPREVTADLGADVSARDGGTHAVALALGPSWRAKLPSYTTLRLTWANGDVTTIDLPRGWPKKDLHAHARP